MFINTSNNLYACGINDLRQLGFKDHEPRDNLYNPTIQCDDYIYPSLIKFLDNKKVESIKQLGADEVIVSTNEEEMKKVRGKFGLILYTIPGVDEFEKYFATTAKKGTFVLLGVGENNDVKFNYFPLLKSDIKVVGSLVGPRLSIRQMVQLCAEKDIFPICEEYDFEDLPKAFDKLENGKPHFRCVLNVKKFAEKNGWKK